ncbi:MAG: RNA polymerase sporulation sigma factor SigK [Bacilli bacterium]
MLFNLLHLIKGALFFTASYSNNVFPEPLAPKEEAIYIEKARLGDKEARNMLIEHNLRLVAHIVKKFEHSINDQDDLISIGTIGLIKGVDSFSKSHGTRITTYCARCIENEILMYFRSNNKNLKNISINESVGFDKDGNEITIVDILKTVSPDYVDEISKRDSLELLNKYLTILSPREREILSRRYGLNNRDEQTQKVIAKELSISRSYVSRIEKRALTKILREFMKNKNHYQEEY